MKPLDISGARAMLLRTAQAVVDAKDYLTEVDSAIGDGDHGIGMETGCLRIIENLTAKTGFADMAELFRETGKAMIFSMGGASGIIFGSMFQGGASLGAGAQELDGKLFSAIMRGSLDAIKRKGKASVGDKTMVDALQPAVEAMESAGSDLYEVLKAAEAGAAQGVENTKKYPAKFGRAVQLGERSIGHQDAGATSVAIIFKAMREYAQSRM